MTKIAWHDLRAPEGPGLGVELDAQAPARAARAPP